MKDSVLLVSDALRVVLHPLGASIVSVEVTGRDGIRIPVALSPDSFGDPAARDPSLAGRTIAPCCGRIRGGEVTVGGKPLSLSRNEGENHIHGGEGGSAYRLWETVCADEHRAVFRVLLEDGQDGYPGLREIKAEYTVDGSALSVTYTARSDEATWFDCTNHVYWDLGGRFDGSAMEQLLTVDAGEAVMNDAAHLPEAIKKAEGAFDFTSPASPAEKWKRYPENEQLRIGRGYNNAFLLRDPAHFAARLCSASTGISMTLTTDQPALVCYTGGFLGADTTMTGIPAVPHAAIALEAQGIPDVWHLCGREDGLLLPGTEWRSFIRWEFSAD